MLRSILLSICPRLDRNENRLVATTSWPLRVLTLGCLYRQVVVDPQNQELTIFRRRFWALPQFRRIRFGTIEAVTYGFADWASFFDINLFAIGVRLRGGDELHLFYFGEDGRTCEEQAESRKLVAALSLLIGVGVAPPHS